MTENDEWVNVAFLGPAQFGKSTLLGFTVHALNEVEPAVMEEAVRAAEERGDLTRKFAFLLDRKPHERNIQARSGRGMTQELSWWGVKRTGGNLLLIDSPGQYDRYSHVFGALSEADAVVMVAEISKYLEALDMKELRRDKKGRILPNAVVQTRSYLAAAHFYGIDQLIVAVHKMDLVNFDQERYDRFVDGLSLELELIGWDLDRVSFIPTAVLAKEEKGHNINQISPELRKWYTGETFVDALYRFEPSQKDQDADFRMQVNFAYQGSRVRVPGFELVITGKVLSGKVSVNEVITLKPSGITVRVRTIQWIDQSKVTKREKRWGQESKKSALMGEIVGLGCTIISNGSSSSPSRGEIAGKAESVSTVSDRFQAELLVLNLPAAKAFLSGRVSGVFGMGHFSTGIDNIELIGQAGSRSRLTREDLQTIDEGERVLVEILLAKKAPLDVFAAGTEVGRFLLLDANAYLVCGGRITKIL